VDRVRLGRIRVLSQVGVEVWVLLRFLFPEV